MGKINSDNIKQSGSLLEFFLLLCSIILVSNTSTLVFNNTIVFIYFVFLFITFLFKKRKFDLFIIYIIVLWFLINLFSYLYNNTEFPIATIFGYLVRILITYFTLKIIGFSFWQKFEKIIYVLTAISIPIFVLNNLFPTEFINLSSVFGGWAADVYTENRELQKDYWYSFIYTSSGRSEVRNAGFMWEAGAFAMMTIFGLLYNLHKNNFRFSRRIIIYTIALITTFSTMGYIALLLIIMLYILNNNSIFVQITFLLILVLIIPTLLGLDFLLPKIEYYLTRFQEQEKSLQVHTGKYEINRISSFVFDFEKVVKYPFGYGVVPDKFQKTLLGEVIVGVNGLSKIVVYWGVLGLFFLLYSLPKFILVVFNNKTTLLNILLVVTIFLITFFSNPIEKNFYLFAVVLTPLISDFKLRSNDL